MPYAIIETGDKQFRVEQGMTLDIPCVATEAGAALTFERVLLCSDGATVRVGTPTVPNAVVKATVVGPTQGKKQVVFKMRRRKASMRKTGHRQDYTAVHIDELVLPA